MTIAAIVPVAHRGVTSYIAAASTPQGKPGYLFANCTVQGNSPAGSVYLGRPWRQYARVYWLDCNLSDEIIPLGWDNWSDPANEETVRFGEYGSKGPGAPKASPARAGYAALNDEASAQEMRAMLLNSGPTSLQKRNTLFAEPPIITFHLLLRQHRTTNDFMFLRGGVRASRPTGILEG